MQSHANGANRRRLSLFTRSLRADAKTQAELRSAERSPVIAVDEVAAASLTTEAYRRYATYRDSLMEDAEEEGSIIPTLSLYVWDLYEGRSPPPG